MITKKALLIAMLVGAVAGQIVADGERNWSLTNTLRVGYDDNLYRSNRNEDDSFFIKDILDLGWRASLSDRTDISLKTQLIGLVDEDANFYPNIYAVLNHAVSPRVLLSLSDYFRHDDRTGEVVDGKSDERYNYYYNRVQLDSSYVANEKTRIQLSLANAIERGDTEIENYDTTRNSVGLSVGRELQPQQTRLNLGVNFSTLEYENIDSDYDQMTASAELGHTFNPQWSGVVGGGVDFIDANYRERPDDSYSQPRANIGLTYTPSPRTRISGSYSYQYETANNTNYIGSANQEVRLGVQHDLTAKVTLQGTARLQERNYEEEDQQTTGAVPSADEERVVLAARVSYKLNRNHYLEAGYEFADVNRDTGDDWQQNKVDIGWRVEI